MKLNKCGCGGEARIDYVHSTSLDEPIYWYVQCTSCWCKIVGMTEERAVTAWNTAHPKAIRLDDVWNIRTCRSYEGDKSCDNCSVSGFCFVLTDGVYKEISDYVEGENGQI